MYIFSIYYASLHDYIHNICMLYICSLIVYILHIINTHAFIAQQTNVMRERPSGHNIFEVRI